VQVLPVKSRDTVGLGVGPEFVFTCFYEPMVMGTNDGKSLLRRHSGRWRAPQGTGAAVFDLHTEKDIYIYICI